MEMLIFLTFALLALGSGVVVVAHRNPVKSTMSLVVTLFSMAVLFVLLGAPFIATLQILVYTGAILVLFLFVIMLLNVQSETHHRFGSVPQRWAVVALALLFGALLVGFLWRATSPLDPGEIPIELTSLKGLAQLLFSDYLLAFEIVGLLLLAAMLAATVLARRPPKDASEVKGAES
jgi:NADH-quinone oxidoreductase subunit J